MAAGNKPATALQVQAWKRRSGYSNAQAAEALDVHPRTFNRWLAGHSKSPKWLGKRFREDSK